MYNNEIKNWLNGPRDYRDGLMLLEKYSRKKPMVALLMRKQKPEVLAYQLGKLAKSAVPKQPQPALPKMAVPKASPKKPGKFLTVDTGQKVNYDDLPDRLKKLFDQNRREYKLMRALHEKMKLAKTDTERAQLRSELVKKDDLIAENWKVLDAWDGRPGPEPEPGPAPAKAAEEIAREINSARVFLSKNLKRTKELSGEKLEVLKAKLIERVELLKYYKAEISEATLEGLSEIGL